MIVKLTYTTVDLFVVGSNPTGFREFFSFSVWAHFPSRAIALEGIIWDIYTYKLQAV